MNIKKFYTVSGHSTFADAALLLIRVVAGIAFMTHGWGKIQNPFGWMGPEAPVPGVFQALAGRCTRCRARPASLPFSSCGLLLGSSPLRARR